MSSGASSTGVRSLASHFHSGGAKSGLAQRQSKCGLMGMTSAIHAVMNLLRARLLGGPGGACVASCNLCGVRAGAEEEGVPAAAAAFLAIPEECVCCLESMEEVCERRVPNECIKQSQRAVADERSVTCDGKRNR